VNPSFIYVYILVCICKKKGTILNWFNGYIYREQGTVNPISSQCFKCDPAIIAYSSNYFVRGEEEEKQRRREAQMTSEVLSTWDLFDLYMCICGWKPRHENFSFIYLSGKVVDHEQGPSIHDTYATVQASDHQGQELKFILAKHYIMDDSSV